MVTIHSWPTSPPDPDGRASLISDAIAEAQGRPEIRRGARGCISVADLAAQVSADMEAAAGEAWVEVPDEWAAFAAAVTAQHEVVAKLREAVSSRTPPKQPSRSSTSTFQERWAVPALAAAVAAIDIGAGVLGGLRALAIAALAATSALTGCTFLLSSRQGRKRPPASPTTSFRDAEIDFRVEFALRGDGNYQAATEVVHAARAILVEALVEKVVLPLFRTRLSEWRQPSFLTVLRPREVPGLAQELPSNYELQGAALDKVERLLANRSGFTIGISGPRGSGKTTLIDWICKPGVQGGRLTVRVDAPVEYDAREFLLHLFATTCQRVLDSLPKPDLPPQPVALPEPDRRAAGAIVALLVPAVMTTIGAVWLTAEAVQSVAVRRYLLGGVALVAGAPMLLKAKALRLRSRTVRRHGMKLLWLSGGVAAVIAGVALIALTAAGLRPSNGTLIAAMLVLVGGLGLEVARVATRSAFRPKEHAPSLPVDQRATIDRAQDVLQRIRYQRAFTAGWSTKVGVERAPITAEMNRTQTREYSEQPWSLPEIVAKYREFLASAAAARPEHGVVIGIDELDKIESAEAAGRFIDDIKSVFGVRGCSFLIAVSEDAMASFERRGLPFRNAFDSAFSEIVRVPFATFDDTLTLLDSRVVGMPLPFVALCHALAGGLPRDVIRIARHLYEVRERQAIADASRRLVADELAGKIPAIVATMGRINLGAHTRAVVMATNDRRMYEAEPQKLLSAMGDLLHAASAVPVAPGALDAATLHRLTDELATFLYFSATVVSFFDRPDMVQVIETAVEQPTTHWFHGLATARQDFTVHPASAWGRLEEFRRAAGMHLVRAPF